ncbi:similar to Saccharomyces cerevisiae YMR201C RAD14 Protein that recognizes and binds damaged DNA during nucleotide excision repair [Maudiozyma saulgeensis]|uniref:Similar to Saccharomyces cerevisiae YMR201C RAD14 Protein that recognizes and binds damaged DNA during nucleotide excision repair n=1 Tax=Maudiozyma saulgeensis TaxID=1789683 RepID=A0A1X7QYT0_9SACH|nr:similar to Saccharomyces cerevisiae YMR201C RAD14 Protein that recognizes and binds damaged DNA during nucleotide excision repair [Kazachstania saulgeensis]
MNAEQKAKIAANRKLALERLKKRGILNKSQQNLIEKRFEPPKPVPTIPIVVTNNNNNNNHNGKPNQQVTINQSSTPYIQSRDASTNTNTGTGTSPTKINKIRPSIKEKDYIEYNFATIKNLNGGYINPQDKVYNEGDPDYYGDDSHNDKKLKTMQDWKNEQKERRMLYENAPPPEHSSVAIKCIECHINIEMDPILDDIFKLKVCKTCAKEHPEKYSLLTKTECKEDYFLTDPELNDIQLFHRLEKPNPHSGTFARMQLFVRCEIENYAYKKWGGEEGLDNEWKRREEGKLKRREKRYNDKIKEMRIKTRAQEYTNRLRDKKYGKTHNHNFSDPIPSGKDEDGFTLLKRRCIECGLETEEVSL